MANERQEDLPLESELEQEAEVELTPEQQAEAEEEAERKAAEEKAAADVKAAEEAKAKEEAAKAEAASEEEGEEDEDLQRRKKTSRERREERKRTERRIREERDYLLQQNQAILQRLAQVEGATIENRGATLDTQLQECLNDAATAENLELDAQQQGDWDGVRQARRLREAAQNRAGLFKTEKERLANALAQRQSQQQTVAPTPGAAEIQRLSAQFRADKPWLQFAANGVPMNDESAVALTIDRALKKEGRYSEYEEAYWDELAKRTKAALPQMFGEAEDEDTEEEVQVRPKVKSQARKGPVVGASGNQGTSGTKVRVSPERVAALKEIGAWDDPKLRAEYLKEYERYDREHGVQR